MAEDSAMSHEGSCHCGRIGFSVEGEIDKLLDCNCSICMKRGALLWFVPRNQLSLRTPEEHLATYTFNTGKIQHRFCPVCGCAPFAETSDAKGRPMAAINARCLDEVDVAAFDRVPFDGRSL
jgi:hypothetical protein